MDNGRRRRSRRGQFRGLPSSGNLWPGNVTLQIVGNALWPARLDIDGDTINVK
jgi:hypothetical protein